MFAANGVRQSIWKDYPTMRKAIQLAGVGVGDRAIRFFALGDSSPPEQVGCVRVEFIPYRSSLAECYQAADIYIHAARADTFPTVILEALACGKPVVATAVGGIPEQIIEGETGFLVPAGDSTSLADRIIRLVQSPELVHTMGAAASHDAAKRFTLERMVSNYIRLYHEMIKQPQ
jgi:glycosyltransferase involved in cell wall biosynthesis